MTVDASASFRPRFPASWGRTTLSWNQRAIASSEAVLPLGKRGPHVLARLQNLAVDHREGRDLLVPLQQGRPTARLLVGEAVQVPHRIDDRPDVRVEDVRAEIRVAR